MQKTLILFLLIVGSMFQSVPQISPVNPRLGETTAYKVNYYSFKNINGPTTYIRVDYSNSKIAVPQGNLADCTIKLRDVPVPSPSCRCDNKVCTFKPNQSAAMNTKVEIIFSGAVNPLYMSNQNLPTTIYFSPTVTQEQYSVTIPFNMFIPMEISINSITQSEWGVGTYPVTYQINVTLPYLSRNPQLQVQIPSELSFNQITSALSLNSAVQNFSPMQIFNTLVFSLQTNPAQSGNLFLSLSGMGNPQFLGNSSSFKITLLETADVMNCANCKIAEIISGLQIESKTPGNIEPSSISSTNQEVRQTNTISLNCLYYAPIEKGGYVKIYLDQSLIAVTPVSCQNVFGFQTSDSKAATCTYDSINNVITTVNFAYPNLVTFGNGIISIKVINPSDSRSVTIRVESYDIQGRMIGISQNPFTFSAIPKSLTATISKSNNYVGTTFTQTTQITIGSDLDLTKNYIEVVYPAEVPYNLTAITCISAGVTLDCNKNLNSAGQLIITMSPPCVQCTKGAKLNFQIQKLRNPDYIDDANKQIYLHIRTNEGIIEGKEANIELIPSDVSLEIYNMPASRYVGSQFDLYIKFTAPTYAVTNGGNLMIQFTLGSIFVAPLVNGQGMLTGLDYDLEVIQMGTNTNSLDNTLQYHNDAPSSLMRISVNICDGTKSVCEDGKPIEITLRGLRMGYMPAQSRTDNISITTTVGSVIATKRIDTSSKSPVRFNTVLDAEFDRSVTNSRSDATIKFVSPNVVFNSAILTLPIGVTFNGQCYVSLLLPYATQYSCEHISEYEVKITMLFDLTYMISSENTYFIHLNDVSTPTSTKPLTFAVETSFNGVVNQRFSELVGMDTALPLQVQDINALNSTVNEINQYTIKVQPKTDSYTGYQIILPKLTSITSTTWASEFGYSLTENSTDYILSKSGKLQDVAESTEKSFTFKLRNNFNTADQAEFTIILKDGTYQVQRVTVTDFKNKPIMLGVNCTSSNRTTGVATTLTCSVDRNNEGYYGQKSMVFKFDKDMFDFSGATYNGSAVNAQNPSITYPINDITPRVIKISILGLKNKRFIPNQETSTGQNSMTDAQFMTKDENGNIIGEQIRSISDIMANKPSNMSCTAVRSEIKSGQYTDLEISCNPQMAESTDYLSIALPIDQTAYMGVSTCIFQDGQSCEILNFNTTHITINYRKNMKVTLKNVLNYHTNTHMLKISTLTNQNKELSEQSQIKITPQIQLENIHTLVTSTSSTVNTQNTLTIQIIPETLEIQNNNLIIISFPDKTFTRQLNTDSCSIVRADGSSFNGCSYAFYAHQNGSNSIFVSNVTFSSFGSFNVQKGQKITANISVTNGPAPYLFQQNSIRVNVNANATTFLSQGNAPLSEIYTLMTSFSKIGIYQQSVLIEQSSPKANEENQVHLSLNFNGNLRTNTEIIFRIPKDSYSIPANSPSLLKQDSNNYYLRQKITCSSSTNICVNYFFQSSFTIKNNEFLKKQRNNIEIYAQYDSLPVSQTYSTLMQRYQARAPPSSQISRSSGQAGEDSIISFTFGLMTNEEQVKGYAHGDIGISMSSDMVNRYEDVSAVLIRYNSSSLENGQAVNSYINNPSFTDSQMLFNLDEQFTKNSLLNRIDITCQNTLMVPIDVEKYSFSITNSTHILYEIQDFQFEFKLREISHGVLIERANSQVTKTTSLTLSAHLPYYLNFPYTSFNVIVTTNNYGPLKGHASQIDLGQHYNQAVIYGELGHQISICSETHCIYENNDTPIIPSLTSLPLPLIYMNVSSEMLISTTEMIQINLSYSHKKEKFVLEIPSGMIQFVVTIEGQTIDENSGSAMVQNNIKYETQIVEADEQNEERYRIQIFNKNSGSQLSLYKLKIYFKTPDYQILIPNARFLFYMEKPSAQKIFMQNINIFASKLNTSVETSSLTINEQNTFTLQADSMVRHGVFKASIPSYISQQFVGADGIGGNIDDTLDQNIAVVVNGVQSNIGTGYTIGYDNKKDSFYIEFSTQQTSASAPEYTIVISDVTNPSDNRPLQFEFFQHENGNSSQIFAYSKNTVNMTSLSQIVVERAERNDSKINENIKIDLIMTLSSINSDQSQTMRIWFPNSQVKVSESLCTLSINGVPIQYIPLDGEESTNDIFLTIPAKSEVPQGQYVELSGKNQFTIEGCLSNSQFSQSPSEEDKVYVSLGLPYQSAETTPESSVFITPLITTGNLNFSNFLSTSSAKLTYTDISFTLTPQNFQNCDGIILVFSENAYYLHQNILVYMNDENLKFQVLSLNELFIQVGGMRSPQMRIKIKKMINFIESGPMTIFTVKRKSPISSNDVRVLMNPSYSSEDYGVIDFVATGTLLSQLVPHNPSIRLIIADAYVSNNDQTLIIMIDSENPYEYPSQGLYLQLVSSAADCSRPYLQYRDRISVSCKFSSSGSKTFTLRMKDSHLDQNQVLGQITKSVYIYPERKQVCSDVLCDQCSPKQGGGQYCFKCREGKYSSNGVCVDECPRRKFPYLGDTCQPCSPDCAECFDIDDSSCLECANNNLLLDSGECNEYCKTGDPYKGYCVDGKQCTTVPGCRLCSNTGHCYVCQPGFEGEPNCSFINNLPPHLFVFFILPFVALTVGMSVYSCVKYGFKGISGLCYYMLAVIEFFSMIFLIARVSTLEVGMIICAAVLFRIIISIVSYETYYLKLLDGNRLLEGREEREENGDENKDGGDGNPQGEAIDESERKGFKMNLVKFSGHLICCEAYELLSCKIGNPSGMNIKHHPSYMKLNIASRILFIVMAIVAVTGVSYPSDLLWLSLLALISSFAILATRFIKSDFVSRCWSKCRGNA